MDMKLTHLLIAAAATLAMPAQAAPRTETALLSGGCYWGMQEVFDHVKGVTNVVAGFAGAPADHAEAVRISFDPAQISYAQILQVYFTVAHDPTEVDRQGPDVGHNYRSAIFPQTPDQERFARAFVARLNAAHVFQAPIATRIESGPFQPVPPDQQHFAKKHPSYAYIVVNDVPKVAALRKKFPAYYKA
jgi:peptide-methionine (S)-S-oxide reductase